VTKKTKEPPLTQADIVSGSEDDAVRQIMGSMTQQHLEELVRWSVRISRAAYTKGWRAESKLSLADWIRQSCGEQTH